MNIIDGQRIEIEEYANKRCTNCDRTFDSTLAGACKGRTIFVRTAERKELHFCVFCAYGCLVHLATKCENDGTDNKYVFIDDGTFTPNDAETAKYVARSLGYRENDNLAVVLL
jgi:hypothetical protein